MLSDLQAILDNCAQCGGSSLSGHLSVCRDQEHRAIAELLLEYMPSPIGHVTNADLEEEGEPEEECDCMELFDKLDSYLEWIAKLIPLPHQDKEVMLKQCIEGATIMRNLILENKIDDDIPF